MVEGGLDFRHQPPMFLGQPARLGFAGQNALQPLIELVHAGEVVQDSLVDAQRRRGHAMARLQLDQAEPAQRR